MIGEKRSLQTGQSQCYKMKRLLREVVPPIMLKTYHRLQHRRTTKSKVKVLARNAALKGRHRDRNRCFVIGNGPSLQRQNLGELRGEIVFVCNFFNLHPQFQEVSPRYYCIADPNGFFPGTYNEHLEIDRSSWYADICAKLPEVEFLVPVEAISPIEGNKWFAGHSTWYVASRGASTHLGFAESDLSRPIAFGMGTIAAIAIPAAIYMGFSKIYLLGCDCNWWTEHLAREDFDAEYKHFYDKNPFLPREANLGDQGLEEEIQSLSNHFKSLRLLKEHAVSVGVEIINATEGGILDVFPRAKLHNVLEESLYALEK
jgi:hypothetical protein